MFRRVTHDLLLTGSYDNNDEIPLSTQVAHFQWAKHYFRIDGTRSNLLFIERLKDFAHSCVRPLVHLAISWLLAEPSVSSVFVGASAAEQEAINAEAAERVLTTVDLAKVRKLIMRPIDEQ